MKRKDFKDKTKKGCILFVREVKFYPAFDKRHEDPSKNYGIHNMEIAFYLRGPEGTIQFKFNSGWHLPHVKDELSAKGEDVGRYLMSPNGVDLGFHALEPRDYQSEPSQESCPLLDGKPCYYDGSTLNAEPVLNTLIEKGDEAVWEELEEYYYNLFGKEK